jgi:hypothetical protein
MQREKDGKNPAAEAAGRVVETGDAPQGGESPMRPAVTSS